MIILKNRKILKLKNKIILASLDAFLIEFNLSFFLSLLYSSILLYYFYITLYYFVPSENGFISMLLGVYDNNLVRL